MLATAVSFPWKRACQLTANAFCIVVILWGVEKFIYPQCEFFLGDREKARYVNSPLLGGPVTAMKAFVFHTMVMPRIRPFEDMKGEWHRCGYIRIQLDRPGAGSRLATVAAALWALLLAIGVWGLFTIKGYVKLRLVVGGTLLGQMALHSIYGAETFIFSLNFAPLLLAVAAMGLHTRLRRVVLVAAACLIFTAGPNNLSQRSKAIDLAHRIYASAHPTVSPQGEPPSAHCIGTSAAKSKRWAVVGKRAWICGDRASITSGRTKLWGCAVLGKFTSLRRGNTREHPRIWSTSRCALAE